MGWQVTIEDDDLRVVLEELLRKALGIRRMFLPDGDGC